MITKAMLFEQLQTLNRDLIHLNGLLNKALKAIDTLAGQASSNSDEIKILKRDLENQKAVSEPRHYGDGE